MSDADSVRSLTEAIADGRSIQWDAAKEGMAPEDLDLVEELEIIANLAKLHRAGSAEESIADGDEDHDDLPEPPFEWGQLKVLQRLGSGSFGQVFRAFDPQLDCEVALKLQPAGPAAAEDIKEGRFLARVRHRNVMHVYGSARVGRWVGIWGELINGHTLAHLMEHHGPMSALEATVVAEQVCRALTAIHRPGLLHRDIKAQNVMREIGGRIVLVDFGLGREMRPSSDNPGRELVGTPLYMAPELFRGESASAQSDVYGVGILLFYLVTARFPVTGDSMEAIAEQHASGRRARLHELRADLPAHFVSIVDRALTPDLGERFRSAGELQGELLKILAPAVPPAVPKRLDRRTAFLGLAAIPIVGALLAALAYVTILRPDPPKSIALTLSAPIQTAFVEGSRNVPAVSPNGQNIAFLAKDAEGDKLWVRDLSTVQPRAIPHTNGAIRPFWSPDGQWIAYFVNQGEQRGLWRVNVSGAQPEFLASGTESRGGSWNRDDVLLLALDPQRGLQAMAARPGAQMRFVTHVETAAKEAQHMWPQFLPDGKHFIFFVLSADDNVEGVYLGSLDGERPKLLVKTHTSALHIGTSLLYTTNGRLFARRLDESTGQLTGAPRPVPLNVDSTYDWLLVLAASETGTLVYRQPELRQLMWYSMTGSELGPLGGPDRFRNPVISPDGAFVVTERYLLDGRDLLAFDLVHNTTEVLSVPKAPSCPTFARDGRLAFAAMSGMFADIFVTDVRRSHAWQPLIQSAKEKEPTSWSADGRALAYVVFEITAEGRQQDLWIASLDPRTGAATQTPFATSPAAEVNGEFSPGGRWIAYVSNEQRRANVYVRHPGEATTYKISAGPALDPQWLSDDTLLYLDAEGAMWQVTIPPDNPTHYTPTRLFRTPVRTPGTSRSNYAIDLTGKRLLFNAWPGDVLPTTFSVIVNWRDQADSP
jgi:serine/threonine protein kinase